MGSISYDRRREKRAKREGSFSFAQGAKKQVAWYLTKAPETKD